MRINLVVLRVPWHIVVFTILTLSAASLKRRAIIALFSRMVQASSATTPDFATFDRLAVQMSYYHNMLRGSWTELYAGTDPDARKPPSPSQLIRVGLHFCRHLETHHDIEEAHWFPVLGRKMEAFRATGFAKKQHKEMHKGLDKLSRYLIACQQGSEDLRRDRVREIMDSFGDVLWLHLDEEVRELGGENMSKFWTLQEMRNLPF
ncbi:hypothetical protein PYCC9005_002996 [Savitreella phatthalungensis]